MEGSIVLFCPTVFPNVLKSTILRENSFCKPSSVDLQPIVVEFKPEISFNFSVFSFSLVDISLINLVILIYLIILFLRSKINRICRKIGKS